MNVTFGDNVKESQYEIFVDGQQAGVEVYGLGEGRISLVHTEIDRSFAGQGLAPQLVVYALNDARAGWRCCRLAPTSRSSSANTPKSISTWSPRLSAQFNL